MSLHIDVMISSTSIDLPEHRKQAMDAILRSKMYPIAMEHLTAEDSDALTTSLDMVDNAEVYVGIIGMRYGYIPKDPERNPKKLSITELEYRRAVERGIPILIFFMSDDHPVPPRKAGEPNTFEEQSADGRKKLARLKKELSTLRVGSFFTSPQELRADIVQALHDKDVIEKAEKIAEASAKPEPEPISDTGIPQPPDLYSVPAYTLTNTFVGRANELADLAAWAKTTEPIMIYEAIGGMGKSALTWEWVQRLLRDGHDYKGIFWYSFYEGGALMHSFLRHAVAYMTKQDPDELKKESHDDLADILLRELNAGRWLLVLDGVERLLVAYHRIDAAQVRDDEVQRDLRDCTSRKDNRLLQKLAGVKQSKLLISTRLMPRALEDAGMPIKGVRRRLLRGLLPPDALDLMRDRGVAWDDEPELKHFMQQIGYHGLLLKVIAGRIKTHRNPKVRGHFDTWYAFEGKALNLYALTDQHRRTHVLAYAFEGLTDDKKLLLSQIAAFSDPVDYETVALFNGYDNPSDFDAALTELEDRGLLQWDRDADTYDLHPVVRGYCFNQLQDRVGTFGRIADYFNDRPKEAYEEAESLDDLRVSLMVYRALVGAGRLEAAAKFYRGSFADALFFQLNAYTTIIELLTPLFPNGDLDSLPTVEDFTSKSFVLTYFTLAYENTGALHTALRLLAPTIQLDLETANSKYLASDLINYGSCLQELNRLADNDRVCNLVRQLADVDENDYWKKGAECSVLQSATLRGDWHETAEAEARLGEAYDHAFFHLWRARGRFFRGENARPLLEFGMKNARYRNWLTAQKWLLALRAEVELADGNLDAADDSLDQALAIARRSNAKEQAPYTALLAEIRLAQGDLQAAKDMIEEAFAMTMIEFDKAAIYNSAAIVYHAAGDFDRAKDYVLQAYKVAWADGEPYSQWYEL
ncbi:MAG: DUF4062 domain-containing protein, partial [Anaerolinea sp.]|nr:DUF4062 domain-containing protein [Anaerolinea sp.]